MESKFSNLSLKRAFLLAVPTDNTESQLCAQRVERVEKGWEAAHKTPKRIYRGMDPIIKVRLNQEAGRPSSRLVMSINNLSDPHMCI